MLREYERQGPIQTFKRRVMDTAASAPAQSVVMYSGLARDIIHECALNPDGVHSDPLILNSSQRLLNAQEKVYASLYPGRRIFVIERGREGILRELPLDTPTDFSLPIRKSHRLTGRSIMEESSGELVRRAVEGDAANWLFFGAYLRLVPGTYLAEFAFDLQACKSDSPVLFDVNIHSAPEPAAVHRVHGSHSNAIVTLEFEVSDLSRVEPRVRYGGSGDLQVTRVRVREKSRALALNARL